MTPCRCRPGRRPVSRSRRLALGAALVLGFVVGHTAGGSAAVRGDDPLGVARGVCVVVGLPQMAEPASLLRWTEGNERLIYFQSGDEAEVAAVRTAAAAAGLLGSRVFAEFGAPEAIHLADRLADAVWIAPALTAAVPPGEVLRVLRPGGQASIGSDQWTKPALEGVDAWSHPYHGPDNNPCSTDQVARAPFRTQFLASPLFSPMPEVTVAAGGRIFKAFGHIAHKANQNEVLNTLVCINAYNGTVLWRRDLHPGFMIHRNTMVATSDTLYLADDQSCKLLDAASGAVRDEIVITPDQADGPVWKWMALVDGVLYALVGGQEVPIDTVRSDTPGIGHWGWGMWKGHEYADPRTNFGFGRTFLAIDPATKSVRWSYQNDEYIDSRGVCLADGKLYFHVPEKYLGCLQTDDGQVRWTNQDRDLLDAIGPNGPAQHYVSGYATQTYIKCDRERLFFAGPQRARLVVASAADGHLLWQMDCGNLQLVLREDGFYCAGPELGADDVGGKYSFDGQRLSSTPIRRACTRATGSVDSVFYRTTGGTVRVDVSSNQAEHIAPMRPPCQDGVIISDGLLFWGPWMCGCQLSLYGHIGLGPAGAARPPAPEPQLQQAVEPGGKVAALAIERGDWCAYQRDNLRSSFTPVPPPAAVRPAWSYRVPTDQLPTAAVMAGGLTFVADRSGAVRALDERGELRWTTLTGGAIYYSPAVADGRLFVGSADGRVYALEAATGRVLWTYRVAPEARWIPVYGKLMSTWPVAGGVIVEKGVVYAAAGIAHYDGTYVVALDAVTGQPRWRNETSGALSPAVNCGISLQGELQLRGDELQFLGGGAYQFGRYDLRTGRCLNEPRMEVTSQFQTAFYPYYPFYAKYVPLYHTFPDGRTVAYHPSYDGSQPTPLAVLAPATAAAQGDAHQPNAQPQRMPIWQTPQPRLFTAFVLTPEIVLVGGLAANEETSSAGGGARMSERLAALLRPKADRPTPVLAALKLSDGSQLWEMPLPALPVKAGLALDHHRRIVATLENGDILGFEAASD